MKWLAGNLLAMMAQRDLRQNVAVFFRYVMLVVLFTAVYSAMFDVLMEREGRHYSVVASVYWTLTVMTTLGFGDITFQSDLGRAFSLLVMLTGVVLLLIVLPFAFIKNFYAPWIEARLKLQVPRELPESLRDHVLICELDAVAQALITRLDVRRIPYAILEPDPVKASRMHGEGLSVMVGEPESVEAWRAAGVERARLVLANLTDTANTNVIITLREQTATTPVVALIEDRDAVDILELAGANHVLPLKYRLGQHLANRVVAGKVTSHVVGRYQSLVIAELPLRGTPLAGQTMRQMGLEESAGVTLAGYWSRGRLHPPSPDVVLDASAVAVLAGSEQQMAALDALVSTCPRNDDAVIVIGGGRVGREVSRALMARGVEVTLLEQHGSLSSRLEAIATRVIIGDAAAIDVMREADIASAPSVVLTTRDDGVNIFLAVYARRLNPRCHIVSRITHERNLEAIHRAGADTVLSESTLGAKLIMSHMYRRDVVLIGETVDLHIVPVPESLVGKSVAQAQIPERTGLALIAVSAPDQGDLRPAPATVLREGATLVMMGTTDQRRKFESETQS